MSMTIGGTSGLVFPDASSQTTAATGFGFKNRIINGAMAIDQRNAGASVTLSNTTSYSVDRFAIRGATGSSNTAQQSSTAPSGFVNSLKITSGSNGTVGSTDNNWIYQAIEGFNVADLNWGTANAKTVTLSFQVYSSLTGTFGGSLQNSASNRSYPFTYVISSANTWTSISVTIAGDTTGTWLTTNGNGLTVFFGLGSGSTYLGTAGAWAAADYRGATGEKQLMATSGATFYITGVQLEKGSTATSFDYRPYGTELQLCQRYYQRIGVFTMQTSASTTTAAFYHFLLPVTPRATPTMSFGNSTWNRMTNFDVIDYSGTYTPAFNDYGEPNLLSFVVRVTSGSTWSANAPLAINPTTKSQAVVIASMEL